MGKNNEPEKKQAEVTEENMQAEEQRNAVKRNIKDSMFTALFGIPKYTLEMYKEMHPEDNGVAEGDIRIVTLRNVFSKGKFNDLGLQVQKRLMVLTEAQSTFSKKIAVRMLEYLAETYNRFIREENLNVYSETEHLGYDKDDNPIDYLPAPEMYVIYTGTKEVPEEIDFSELYNAESNGNKTVSLRIKVIRNADRNTIIGQYIEFCRISDEERGKNKDDRAAAIDNTIRRCKQEGILYDFICSHETEVRRMIGDIFDQEYADEAREHYVAAEARAEGRVEERKDIARNMIEDKLPDETIMKYLGITSLELNKIREEM